MFFQQAIWTENKQIQTKTEVDSWEGDSATPELFYVSNNWQMTRT